MKKLFWMFVGVFRGGASSGAQAPGERTVGVLVGATETNSQGTFRLVRPEGPKAADGSFDVAIWQKEGDTNRFYMRTLGGLFTGID